MGKHIGGETNPSIVDGQTNILSRSNPFRPNRPAVDEQRSIRLSLRVELETGLLPSAASDLAYGSLSSVPSLGNRWRVGVEFDAVTMDQKHRAVTPHIMVLDHGHVAIVEREPIPVEPCRDNGVILFPAVVSQDHNAKVIRRNPCLLEGNELCDRVIFAVPGTYGECRQGRTPDVLRTIKC